MTVAHEVSAAKESISVTKTINFDTFEKTFEYRFNFAVRGPPEANKCDGIVPSMDRKVNMPFNMLK